MSDLTDRLRRYGSLKIGELFPDDLGGPNEWGPLLTQTANEAAARIEYLESVAGAVSQLTPVDYSALRKGPQQQPPSGLYITGVTDAATGAVMDMGPVPVKRYRKEPLHHDYDEPAKLKPEGSPMPDRIID